jgi:rhodanese-related sulfurtransferase
MPVAGSGINRKAADGYAGDVLPPEAWRVLSSDPQAQLIDVRTIAEWAYVGGPDLSAVGKDTLRIEWLRFPAMEVAPDFVEQMRAGLARLGTPAEAPLFFLCRSGARSAAAAGAATQAGYTAAHNIAHGFEGDPDPERHRGRVNGWKVDGLPWQQK